MRRVKEEASMLAVFIAACALGLGGYFYLKSKEKPAPNSYAACAYGETCPEEGSEEPAQQAP